MEAPSVPTNKPTQDKATHGSHKLFKCLNYYYHSANPLLSPSWDDESCILKQLVPLSLHALRQLKEEISQSPVEKDASLSPLSFDGNEEG